MGARLPPILCRWTSVLQGTPRHNPESSLKRPCVAQASPYAAEGFSKDFEVPRTLQTS